jgi:hypothetical protein
LGWGTLFAALVTGGIWLLAIPFYPKRCIICGSKKESPIKVGTIQFPDMAPKDWYKTWWGILIIIFALLLMINVFSRL